jgi:saccharopine dehydrogenase-like NADP-dependent oxidoreductase
MLYKIVFGSQLPLLDTMGCELVEGKLVKAPRYAQVEEEDFPSVGRVEAFTEDLMPWLPECPVFAGLRHGTQKTYRWPGCASRVQRLSRLGFLSNAPIPGGVSGPLPAVVSAITRRAGVTPDAQDIKFMESLGLLNGSVQAQDVLGTKSKQASPKQVLDAVVASNGSCSLAKEERDITLISVTVSGISSTTGKPAKAVCRMLDRASPPFSSMARTSAFTAAAAARLAALKVLQPTSGTDQRIFTAEQAIHGPIRIQLLANLDRRHISFTYELEGF